MTWASKHHSFFDGGFSSLEETVAYPKNQSIPTYCSENSFAFHAEKLTCFQTPATPDCRRGFTNAPPMMPHGQVWPELQLSASKR